MDMNDGEGMSEEIGAQGGGGQRGKNEDNYNSILSKIQFKKRVCLTSSLKSNIYGVFTLCWALCHAYNLHYLVTEGRVVIMPISRWTN